MEDPAESKSSNRQNIILIVGAAIILLVCLCLIIVAGIGLVISRSAESLADFDQLLEITTFPEDEQASSELPTLAATVPLPTDTAPAPDTPEPTNTLVPTTVPEPTDTPAPTETLIPDPTPIALSGSGDSIIDLDRGDDPSIALITYSGSENFSVVNYGADGEYIDLLVNTIGTYEGTVAFDLLEGEHTTRFEVTATGPWTIEVLPLIEARGEFIPGLIQGVGDDVFFIDEGIPDTAFVEATTPDSNFVVWTYGDFQELLVNEIAPYQGTILMDPEAILVVVNAEGPWSMDITSP